MLKAKRKAYENEFAKRGATKAISSTNVGNPEGAEAPLDAASTPEGGLVDGDGVGADTEDPEVVVIPFN